MLSTSGYFRDILCPFLKTGLCERSHCHYRHDNRPKKIGSKPSTSTSVPNYVPTPVSQLKTSLNNNSNKTNNKQNHSFDNNSIDSNVPVYKPTPISQLKKQQIGSYGYSYDESKDNSSDNISKIKKTKTKPVDNQIISSNTKQRKSTDNQISDNSKTKTLSSQPVLKVVRKSSDSSEPSIKKSKTRKIDSNSDSNEYSTDSEINSNKKQKTFDEIIGGIEQVFEQSNKKVRVAHQASLSLPTKKAEPKRQTPKQVMHQRFAAQTVKTESNANNDNKSSSITAKPRIAHKPNINDTNNKEAVGNSVVGKKRIAHKPNTTKRPTITGSSGNKIPLKTRQQYLDKFIDEYFVFIDEEEVSFRRGLESEKSVYDRSKTVNIYKNIAVQEVKKIRSEANIKSLSNNMSPQKMKELGNQVVSHEAILNGKISGTFSVEKRQKTLKAEDLNDIELYRMLQKYLMTEQQLKDYGYPRFDPNNRDRALLPKPDSTKIKNNYESRVRTCSRCQKIYSVDEDDMPVRKEVCIYHSGRLWNERFNRSIERKYSCCKNDSGSDGCCSNNYHIVNGFDRPDYNTGYVRTLPMKPPPQSGFFGIYGLDCEMCYTTHGLELTRVTVVNAKHQTIYETLVKPSHPILDYNSKFSGIKEGDLNRVNTTICDVQTRLRSLFNDKTILIGHSLESDLKALKLIHDTVIDTAQVFPHKRGLPYKRALRTLTAEFLQKIIQDDVDGHDSQEDATAALKLMLWKIHEDLKKFKR